MIKAIKRGLPFSYGVQILTTICKVSIPLLVAFICFHFFQEIMAEMAQFLGLLFVCETAAGFVNPLPQWAHENEIEQEENRVKKLLTSLGVIKEEDKK